MTQLELEAVFLFKEYTHLQLKTFKWDFDEKLKIVASGATDSYESQLLIKALDLHNRYIKHKLNQKNDNRRN